MTHVVIVGAGIAGVPAAYAMRRALGPEDEITVVSDKDYFQFVPSNPWVAMGWREREDIAFPIGRYLKDRNIRFVPVSLAQVDALENRIRLADGAALRYDFLILATGPECAYDEIPGLGPWNGHTQSVIQIEEAQRARDSYQAFLRKPGPVIIGAVEHASILGPLYECAFLVDSDLRRRNIRERVPITIVTPEPYVGHLGIGGDGHTRRLLESALAQHNIRHLCNARTVKVDADTVHVLERDDEGKDKQTHALAFAYSIYWPAFRGVEALRNSTGLTNASGFVALDQYLRHPQFPNVYAVGVCAAHPATETTPVAVGAPESAYSIQKEVDTATGNIIATLSGGTLSSAEPERAKWLTDMGETGATYLSEPQIPLRNINWLKQGRWVHMAKVDFEHYFINKVKLKPSGAAPSMHSRIASVVCRLETSRIGNTKVPRLNRRLAKPLRVPVQRDLDYELRALASALDSDPGEVAGQLLAAAIQDARTYLSEELAAAVERTRREIVAAELPENQPGVEFEGGAP
ncbi:MAG: FAD-dependent oxidoreductase [Gammaproteobacteria bacterium]